TDESAGEEVPEYTQYVDEKYAAELMAETESVADDDLPSTSLRKGPASETAEPEPAVVTESGGHQNFLVGQAGNLPYILKNKSHRAWARDWAYESYGGNYRAISEGAARAHWRGDDGAQRRPER